MIGMKEQYFGVEVEMTGITRRQAAQALANYGLLWKLTLACEQALDRYEGYPRHYTKEPVTVRTADGAKVPVMAYVMAEPMCRQPALESRCLPMKMISVLVQSLDCAVRMPDQQRSFAGARRHGFFMRF